MRDNIPALAFIRMIPFAPAPSAWPTSTGAANFATELKRATATRAEAGQPRKYYLSPLKQSTSARMPKYTYERSGSTSAPPRRVVITRPSNIPQSASPSPLTAPSRTATAPGGATTAAPDVAWSPDTYPHPDGDNGRGMHWIPTTKQSVAAIDRFVAEAQHMRFKWATFLNNGANIGDNDYLVRKLVGAGIEPVMRLYTPTLESIQGDIAGMVRHYTALGVHYFQPFNEPNLDTENPDGQVSVGRYLDVWIPAARAILAGGGLPAGARTRPAHHRD